MLPLQWVSPKPRCVDFSFMQVWCENAICFNSMFQNLRFQSIWGVVRPHPTQSANPCVGHEFITNKATFKNVQEPEEECYSKDCLNSQQQLGSSLHLISKRKFWQWPRTYLYCRKKLKTRGSMSHKKIQNSFLIIFANMLRRPMNQGSIQMKGNHQNQRSRSS